LYILDFQSSNGSAAMQFWLSFLFAGCSAASWAGTIRLVAPEYPPYASASTPDAGAMVELIQQTLGKKYQVKIVFLPWARALSEVNSGTVDGAILMWPVDYAGTQLSASRPIFMSKLGFYTRVSEPLPTVDLSQLRGKVIGTVRAYGYPTSLKDAGVIFEDVNDDQTNLKKLSAARIDRIIAERAVGQYLLRTLPTAAKWSQQVTWREPAIAILPLTIGFAKTKPEVIEAAAFFEQEVQRLKKSGQLRELAERYEVELP
jgi:polar amino acid transport system substrate-binding protein